jgi:plasmid replication initiation protein
MEKKPQQQVIKELQNSPDYIILNNPLSAPKFIRKISMKKEVMPSEVYTPKLFYEIISRLKPEHLLGVSKEQNITLKLSIKDFLKSVDAGNSKNLYRHVIDCVDRLQVTQVKWTENALEKGTTIISYYEHNPQSGEIEVQIHSELAKKVLELTYDEHFSFLKKYLYRLKNAQAVKLFPHFARWRNRGVFDMTLEAFKKKFGYDTEGYTRYKNLKTRVLEPALKEINEKTDLTVRYEEMGENMDGIKPRISSLRFFINDKTTQARLDKPQKNATVDEETTTQSGADLVDDKQMSEIIRVFNIFEPEATEEAVRFLVGGLSGLGSIETILEAALYAEQEQLKRQKAGKALIENFRGFLIAGIPKGMGKGILVQKEKAKQTQKAQVVKQKTASETALKLEELSNQAEAIREKFRIAVNDIVRKTATEEEKEAIVTILQQQSPMVYGARTLEDFRKPHLAGVFVSTFMATYPTRFEAVKSKYEQEYFLITKSASLISSVKFKAFNY